MRKLTHQEIVARQKAQSARPRIPLTVILDNLRSLHNVGSIFRTADGLGVEKIWLCGITGYPPQPGLCKVSLGAEDRVAWEHRASGLEVVRELQQKGVQIIALEQTTESRPYDEIEPDFPAALIVGNEISGISEDLIPLCDTAIEIEMMGVKNSLNAAVAFSIAAFHLGYCFRRKSMMR